jgi:ATP-dependent Clp endopeptidase proteolytic subunit ClpP
MYELRAQSAKETDILMYGSIGEWGRVRAEDVYKAISDAKAKGYVKVNLKINSPGGSIFEGIAILSQMNDKDIVIHACVEGIAASMASVILQGARKRSMVRGGRLMIHEGSGGVYGNTTDIRNYADLLESLNKTMADIYAKSTKKDAKWILENWMADGKDTWFTAEQALKAGLIDEIVDDKVKPMPKEEASLVEMAAHYNQFLKTDSTQNQKMDKEQLIKLLGLKADATEAEIMVALAEMKAKATTSAAPPAPKPEASAAPAPTKPAVEGSAEDKAKLVDAVMEIAKSKGVTDEKQLAAIKVIAGYDIKAAMDILPSQAAAETKKEEEEKPPVAANLNDLITLMKGATGNGAAASGDRKGWSYSEWQAKDSAGLMTMARTKPKEFAALFAAEHGYTPTEAEIKELV